MVSVASLVAVYLIVVIAHLASPSHAATVVLRMHSPTSDDRLHELLMQQSDPLSPFYGQHQTLDSLRRLLAADQRHVEQVQGWLAQHQFQNVRLGSTGELLFATVDDATAAKLFRVSPTTKDDQCLRRRAAGVVPRPLHELVRRVLVTLCEDGVVKRPSLHRVRAVGSSFPGMIQTPATVIARYGVPNSDVVASANFSQGVAEFEGEQFDQSQIDTFNAHYGYPNNTIEVSGPNDGGYYDEGVMDLEYIQTIAAKAKTWWIAEKQFDFTSWAERVLQIRPIPLVLSISWGSGESGFDASSMHSDSDEFRKLGLLGVSLLSAAGDQGTGSTGFFTCGTFDPTWPATSPYVTAVGGTYSNSASDNEVAWDGSGGGFSTVFPRPSYQAAAVQHYLTSPTANLPPSQYYNQTGRGIPDVAALSCNFEVFAGAWGTETGTSAATPTFAAIISRIVAERVASGQPSLGFLNPALYTLPTVGFDVTSGSNPCSPCTQGFSATTGWDPISGLGTPLYSVLYNKLRQ